MFGGGGGGMASPMSVMAPQGGMMHAASPIPSAYVKPQNGSISCNEFAWGELKHMLDNGGVMENASMGEAIDHTKAAREEAARKIISNHLNLLKDICNPSPSNNIDGIPLTQLELTRVDAQMAPHIDEALCEVTRRLMGSGTPYCLHSSPAACDARGIMARYLDTRIHSTPEQKPGRNPDMSQPAAMAFKAILNEVAETFTWQYLQEYLGEYGASNFCEGAAGRHSQEARHEAATKIISNHFRLLKDVCNPSTTTNTDGIALTQLELVRVDSKMAAHMDRALQEVARRLLGMGPPGMLNPSTEVTEARATMARYLDIRIQSDPSQKKGRTPDLSGPAAAAMKDVLMEIGCTSWEPLKMTLASGGAAKSVAGEAGNHAHAVREEAARAILGNHFRLLKDVCNPRKFLNVDDLPLTQPELERVSAKHAPFVDQQLRECVRRLLGRGHPEPLTDSMEAQGARAACAKYLDGRIHGEQAQKPDRKPDMSPKAAAAVKAILYEISNDKGAVLPSGSKENNEKVMSLAVNLETLASHLKQTGQLTPRQVREIQGHLQDITLQSGSKSGESKSKPPQDSEGSRARVGERPTAQQGSSSCSIM